MKVFRISIFLLCSNVHVTTCTVRVHHRRILQIIKITFENGHMMAQLLRVICMFKLRDESTIPSTVLFVCCHHFCWISFTESTRPSTIQTEERDERSKSQSCGADEEQIRARLNNGQSWWTRRMHSR